jgi:hypothetical protein
MTKCPALCRALSFWRSADDKSGLIAPCRRTTGRRRLLPIDPASSYRSSQFVGQRNRHENFSAVLDVRGLRFLRTAGGGRRRLFVPIDAALSLPQLLRILSRPLGGCAPGSGRPSTPSAPPSRAHRPSRRSCAVGGRQICGPRSLPLAKPVALDRKHHVRPPQYLILSGLAAHSANGTCDSGVRRLMPGMLRAAGASGIWP